MRRLLGVSASFALVLFCAMPVAAQSTGVSARFKQLLSRGDIVLQLSEPEEVKAALGPPSSETNGRDGEMELVKWDYGEQFALFFGRDSGRDSGRKSALVLLGAQDGDRRIVRAPTDPLVLRTTADLARLRPFTGLQNVDLSRLDLREEEARLREMTFDTKTVWPPADRLPRGFDPATVLRDGKNPGLNIRGLHSQGIDGRGVTIAIIDQPLLREHQEIVDGRLTVIAELDVKGAPPQMHGPAVSSIAAGRSVGVAPAANVAYVAMASWKAAQSNAMYIQALERVLEYNKQHTGGERVRAVSISYGGFATAALFDEWKAALAKADAEGVLVITCDREGTRVDLGMLKPVPGGDREKPEGYVKGTYGWKGLMVPADGRTYASKDGPATYIYGAEGGLSWVPPYLCGLAALGYQVNPDLTPDRVRAYLVRTATPTAFGSVVNPPAFVKMCREDPDKRAPATAAGASFSR